MYDSKKSFGRLISISYRYAQIFFNKRYKPYGLGSGQYSFLLELYQRDGIRQEDLARALNFDKATTARALGKLEEQGFITREVGTTDRRAKHIFLTDKARKFEKELFNIRWEWAESLAAGFSDEERKQVLGLLQRIADNAEKHVATIREEK